MDLSQDQMDSLTFNELDPLHIISKQLGEVLDDLDFETELVDEAKKLFILADVSKSS